MLRAGTACTAARATGRATLASEEDEAAVAAVVAVVVGWGVEVERG